MNKLSIIGFLSSLFTHLVGLLIFLEFSFNSINAHEQKVVTISMMKFQPAPPPPPIIKTPEVVQEEVVEEVKEKIVEKIVEKPKKVEKKIVKIEKKREIVPKEVKKVEIPKELHEPIEEANNTPIQSEVYGETKNATPTTEVSNERGLNDDVGDDKTTGGSNNSIDVGAQIQAIIAKYAKKHYPNDAKRRRQTGIVSIAFAYKTNRAVENLEITKSSGYTSLDNAVLNAIEKTKSKFPDTPKDENFKISIKFILN